MNYISCFSGIGGFEGSLPPSIYCEIDEECQRVLRSIHPLVEAWSDIQTLRPPTADLVVGGWPCQDISVAGKQAGLTGLKSRLLIDMLRIAKDSGASTVAAENVSNLLRMRRGYEFRASLDVIHQAGFNFISWRLLNARAFGLPQHRQRLIIVASKRREVAYSLFRKLPDIFPNNLSNFEASGFYWTAGTHSINYSRGYLPTIKIGSGLGIASPPALHYLDVVRPVTSTEALRLQGFDYSEDLFSSPGAAFRMAGNAVARPIGKWVIDGLSGAVDGEPLLEYPHPSLFDIDDPPNDFPDAGFSEMGIWARVRLDPPILATNLSDFIDADSPVRLSKRAASGLLRRVSRSGQSIPPDLRLALESISGGI